jgi:hypothetical protein
MATCGSIKGRYKKNGRAAWASINLIASAIKSLGAYVAL